jgi:acetyl-CoA acetyltransferase
VNPNGNVYLVSAARTPIGPFGGALAGIRATLCLGGGGSVAMAFERA